MSATTVQISVEMNDRLKNALRTDGYGGKGHSRWISEAVCRLKVSDPLLTTVGLADSLETLSHPRTIILSHEARLVLDDLIRVAVTNDPRLPGPNSAIIRAAIRARFAAAAAATSQSIKPVRATRKRAVTR